MKKFIKQIPNILTTSRVGMAGIFIYSFLNGNPNLAFSMFALASVTDFLDGFLARKLDAMSKYGKTLDPIADKLLMGSALLLYGSKYNALMYIPLIMESIIASITTTFALKNKVGSVNMIGKVKTTLLMFTMSLALLKSLNIESLNFISTKIINSLILGTTALQGTAAIKYIKDGIKNEKNEGKSEEKKELSIEERIEILEKEKQFLLNNNNYEKTKSYQKTKKDK